MNKRRLAIWILIFCGLGLQLVCGAIGRRVAAPANIFSLLGMAGTIVLLIGCAVCAEEKGYSRNYGLLALLSLFGVILLTFLPRREKDLL